MLLRVFGGMILATSAVAASASDWPQFRGPHGSGVCDERNLPTQWGHAEHVRWRTALPAPGNGSPIVSRGKVFVTVSRDEGRRRTLICVDRATGQPLWDKSARIEAKEPTHGTNPHGSTTPAADGEHIVVWHSSAGLHCFNYDGDELWSRDLGTFSHIWGYAASPIIHNGRVVLNCGPGERTFLVAFDVRSGKELWRTDEPGGASGLVKIKPDDKREPWIGSWSTPIVVSVDGRDQILVSFPHHVNAYDPATGKILWTCDGLGDLVYTSIVPGDTMAVAMGGFHGPAIGFRYGGSGNVTQTHRLWHATKSNPQRIGSGVIVGKHLFMANADTAGTVQCLEVSTGKEVWRDRLSGGSCWGSMLFADGRLYVTNQRGETVVLAPNVEKLEVIAVNELGEASNSTPALSDGEVFLRTNNALYCIGGKAP